MANTIDDIEEKTTYFDLNKKDVPEGVKCTLYSLCKEISTSSVQEKGFTVEDIMKKFHNNDGSGIIDHLKKDIKFDVEEYDDFQKLQFLKLLYRYEKDKSGGNDVFQITKVLCRPRLENIYSPYFDVNTRYGHIFEKLLTELESVIGKEEAEERKRILVFRNQRWNNALSTMMELTFEEEALKKENFEIAKEELIVIRDFLDEKIYKKLKEPEQHKPVDNIFMAFYTYLIEHKMICSEEDRVMSYKNMKIYEPADDEYVKAFVEWDKFVISQELQEQILDRMISDGYCPFEVSGDKTYIVEMNYMIFKKHEKLNKMEISALRFVRKYLDYLRQWVQVQKSLEIPEGSLLASWFIAIVQEVAYCKMNHVDVRNDAYGIEEKKKTLTATLKNADKAEAKHIQEWMIRIENRYNSDIGGTDLHIIGREVESIFEKIRKWALQYHDLSDFIFVDDALVHTVERMVVPRNVAKRKLDELGGKLGETGMFRGIHYDGTVGLYNLGREMVLDKTMMDRLVNAIVKNKKEFDKTNLVFKRYKDYIIVHNEPFHEEYEFFYMYSFDENGIIRITYFRPIGSDEVLKKYASYGMGELAITS